jgi:predicted transcriptional regulator
MSQAERLKKVINSLLESPKSFSESIGLPSPTTIYDILASKRKLTPAIMKKIIETYPNLNPDWRPLAPHAQSVIAKTIRK